MKEKPNGNKNLFHQRCLILKIREMIHVTIYNYVFYTQNILSQETNKTNKRVCEIFCSIEWFNIGFKWWILLGFERFRVFAEDSGSNKRDSEMYRSVHRNNHSLLRGKDGRKILDVPKPIFQKLMNIVQNDIF